MFLLRRCSDDERPGSQPGQPTIVVMACAAGSHREALSHIAQTELLETHEFERRPLSFRQQCQSFSKDPAALVVRQPLPAFTGAVLQRIERLAAVGGPSSQSVLSSKAPVIRVLKQPHPHRSSRRIVLMRLTVHLEEDVLGDVLRFTSIMEDVRGNASNEPAVPAEQRSKGIAIARADVGHQLRIGFKLVDRVAGFSATSHAGSLHHDGHP